MPTLRSPEAGVCAQTELTRKEIVMKLWLANFDPQATDDELPEVARLTREAGDVSRPMADLEFDKGSRQVLCEAQRRLSGLHWETRSVTGYVPL